MKKLFILMIGIGFVLGVVGSAAAATQTVTISVAEINALEAAGSPVLTVNSATAGELPDAAETQTSYSITTNASGRKITGSISPEVPTGTTLTVEMAGGGVGTSAGPKALTAAEADLVTGISKARGTSLTVDWSFTATLAADPFTSQTHTVTFTLTGM